MKGLPPYRSEEENRIRTEQNKKDRKRRLEALEKNWSKAKPEPVLPIVQSTKRNIRNSPNKLERQDKIILGIENIVGQMTEKNRIAISSQNNLELRNVKLKDLSLIYRNPTDILSETIFDLEKEKSIIQKRLKNLNRVSSGFSVERKLIEVLTIIE